MLKLSHTQSDVTYVPPTDTKSKSLATPTNRTGGGGAPKTLADFQKLTSRGKQSPAGQPTQSNRPKVRHTVDLRAEAIEENMLLAVESFRAIGCSVTDNMVEELTRGDKGTIDKLIIELIKSRLFHMPGMEDEPSSTFNDLSTLMSKLGLTYTDSGGTNGGTGTDSSDGGGRVRHTVDLRALTKTPPPTASTAEKTEAIEENMLP
uniref:Uncharacterized protein n=1 Tax=Amphimedon queenslandica TaxID=400682 RepID=A0A1X7THX5_AMPQE